ncbi:hypothetical protein CKAH01_12838 [Colletotrichum kahawae]|uniref:Uncharacterized protein n=1 Tax=Colletotrichum kahawae TaxID=34407 RepID=A0AAE0DC76_COLKA|nr:hypothetical protein CKAH01_12838 [Colletotrichum kahawae]
MQDAAILPGFLSKTSSHSQGPPEDPRGPSLRCVCLSKSTFSTTALLIRQTNNAAHESRAGQRKRATETDPRYARFPEEQASTANRRRTITTRGRLAAPIDPPSGETKAATKCHAPPALLLTGVMLGHLGSELSRLGQREGDVHLPNCLIKAGEVAAPAGPVVPFNECRYAVVNLKAPTHLRPPGSTCMQTPMASPELMQTPT